MIGHKSHINVLACAVAAGIVWGLVIFVFGIVAATSIEQHPVVYALFATLYVGFVPTIGGSFIGFLWGFFHGFIAGLIFSLVYNLFSGCISRCCEKCRKCRCVCHTGEPEQIDQPMQQK